MSETARLKFFHNEFVVKFVALVCTIKLELKIIVELKLELNLK
jgi:hypothetical protein